MGAVRTFVLMHVRIIRIDFRAQLQCVPGNNDSM